MDFRLWLESIKKLDLIGKAIESAFPTGVVDFQAYGPTQVFQVRWPDTGRIMNISYYKRGHDYAREYPNGVQIGFFMEDRDKYGQESKKDPASRATLMPGTLDFFHGLKKLIALLKEKGFNPWMNPIDERRAKLFAKLLR
jgi:hypothetical protein